MSIFSRIKKARNAPEEHQKAAVFPTESRPPPRRYKHVPTHDPRDALSNTPTIAVSAEEVSSRIAAVRRMKSDTSLRDRQCSQQLYNDGRAGSKADFPLQSIHRSQSSMSLDEVVMEQTYRTHLHQPVSQERDQQPRRRPYEEHSVHRLGSRPAFVEPRDVPTPPPHQQISHRSLKSTSSVRRMKSPLSNIAMEEEPDDYFSSSSKESKFSATSSQSTSTSSSNFYRRTASIQSDIKLPRLSMSGFISAKPKSTIELFALCSSDDDSTGAKKSRCKVPAWRYEDYERKPDGRATTASSQKRKLSLSSSFKVKK